MQFSSKNIIFLVIGSIIVIATLGIFTWAAAMLVFYIINLIIARVRH